MTGYDANFLRLPVPLPEPAEGRELDLLPSTHFTVGFDRHRKLAAFTAVNIDGAAILDLPRGDDWHLDPRIPENQQTGPAVYAKNDLDRGHLVRRRDPVWGDAETARRANVETFAYTNAAPQASTFNQRPTLWAGLEDYVLDAAQTTDSRISVMTGPVFASTDASYRGTLIPKRFWKIAAWRHAANPAALRATGYVLDQTELVRRFDDAVTESVAAEPDLGRFRTFQVPIRDIASLTALHLDALVAADRYRGESALPGGVWREVESFDDLVL